VTWAVLSLPAVESWMPERLLARSEDPPWPPHASHQLVAIRELATSIASSGMLAESGQSVVTPGGVSLETGQVIRTTREYSGRVYLVGEERGLAVGDLLVPGSPRHPPLLLGTGHIGLAFAATFHALRPMDSATGALLWAVLSSGPGQEARHRAATGTTVAQLSRSALLGMLVPLPPVTVLQRVRPLLGRAQRVSTGAGDVERSWWRTVRLPAAGRWDLYIAVAEPERLRGVRLGELCAEIRVGRDLGQRPVAAPRPGWLPVYTSRSVRLGRISDLWIGPDAQFVIAEPGDVLVPAVGLAAPSTVAAHRGAVDRDVLVCRLLDPTIARDLVRYLNSDAGQALRGATAAGIIPRLTAATARELPIDVQVLRRDARAPAARQPSLAEQLDGLIWL
jgi:hypothetical protein